MRRGRPAGRPHCRRRFGEAIVAYYMEVEGNGLGMAWIFNINQTVTKDSYCRKPDVMLVQHALNTLLAPLGLKDKAGKPITAYLKRDGICGPKTSEAIAAYQRSLLERRRLVKADGIVSPSSRSGWNARGDAQYTIVYLNRDHRRDIHGRMMDEKDFPLELQADIKAHAHLGRPR